MLESFGRWNFYQIDLNSSQVLFMHLSLSQKTLKKFDKNYGMITHCKIQHGISYQVQIKTMFIHNLTNIQEPVFIHFHFRRDAKHIFECFLEVGQPEDYSQNPYIIQSYPLKYKDTEKDNLKSVPGFTFPCKIEMWVIFWHIYIFTNVLLF